MSSNSNFPRISDPGSIGRLKLKNRMIMAPMITCYGSKNGYVSKQMKRYYEERARGGVGLIIVEGAYVYPRGQGYINQLNISDDKFMPGMSKLVQAIHKHSAKAAIQLDHFGKTAPSRLTGTRPVAPSSIAAMGGDAPEELTVEGIEEIISQFSRAALLLKKVGFDAIEILAVSDALIGQFISRAHNKRRDIYGGDLRNRTRFLVQVIEAVREALGADYAVWCRMDAKDNEWIRDGITAEEGREVARIAQETGSQAIHVYAGSSGAPAATIERPIMTTHTVHLVEGIKKGATVPVIAVGGVDPEAAESVLQEGKADFISMGKALIADPELPKKVISSRLADITPCILCMRCVDNICEDSPVECSVNALAGREADYTVEIAERPREVLIVGGGPAGMEAARVAVLRGHDVVIYEKDNKLGGQLNQAAM